MPPWMMPRRRTARERWAAAIAYAKNRAKVTIIVKHWSDTSPSLLCFLSCSIMFIMPFMSFMNFMWPKPEPGAVMCGWNDMSEGRILKFGDDAPTVAKKS